MPDEDRSGSVSTALEAHLRRAIVEAGGWLPFERFMELALYAPGLGYYARDDRQFGLMPQSGSDFVTAPELSPLFGRALARQIGQLLQATGTDEVWEFGAGSGALALQLLQALDEAGTAAARYSIVDLSGALRGRQRSALARFGDRVRWLDALPDAFHGVIVGNEVLDAMPVQLVAFDGERWLQRGVVVGPDGCFAWQDRPGGEPPAPDVTMPPGSVTERPRQATAFVATVAERLRRGAALFLDYGFPRDEFYHPHRSTGTLMCHRGHVADANPLLDVGLKDITAHVDFTAVALAAQAAGCEVIGYTSQSRFLIGCGLLEDLAGADARTLARAQPLVSEHEMGELFKAIAFARGLPAGVVPIGFARGDRTHRL